MTRREISGTVLGWLAIALVLGGIVAATLAYDHQLAADCDDGVPSACARLSRGWRR